MISGLIDKLRKSEQEWNSSNMFELAHMCHEAADTIWELRDDLQRVNAENAKLREDLEFERSENGWAREFLNRMGQKCGTKDCPSLVAYVTKLKAENAKLRELAAGIGYLLFVLDIDYCVACPRDSINHPCPVYTGKGGECLYKTDLRELGVEVE